jgi:hypothetical protein
MKNLILVLMLSVFSLAAHAVEPDFESNEVIRISVSPSTLTCQWLNMPAHAGSDQLPIAILLTNEISDTVFTHNRFTGQASVPNDFSCRPITALIASAGPGGKITVQKNIQRYTMTYQDSTGAVTAVEKREVVRLTLPNGTYLESLQYSRQGH